MDRHPVGWTKYHVEVYILAEKLFSCFFQHNIKILKFNGPEKLNKKLIVVLLGQVHLNIIYHRI